jgi:hypothetical protein
VAPTGVTLADCSTTAFGAVSEFDCSDRRTVYVGNRYLGMVDEFELGPAVRYSATVNGALVYAVILSEHGVARPFILLAMKKGWSLLATRIRAGAC